VSLPAPEPGLVIRYSYLWHSEFLSGREDGSKDRPCVIVLTILLPEADRPRVIVVPMTHTRPLHGDASIEMPTAVKNRLGLDHERSWLILDEHNEFDWPGSDIRRIGDPSTGPFA
jgi:hypothetical protein